MKKDYLAPSVEVVEIENGAALLAGSAPSGAGTSTDHGSGSARYYNGDIFDDEY